MAPSSIYIDKIDCLDGTSIDILTSNANSPTIKVVEELMRTAPKERFYDFLLENFDALKLMTNALVDMKKTDEIAPVFLFSSKLEKDPGDGRNSRKEFSEQCKYRLVPEMGSISKMIQPYQQMLVSGTTQPYSAQELMQEKRKEMIFCLNDFYGYSLDSQLNQGFLDREQLISLSEVSCEIYENLITKFLQMEICSVFQHICWCKDHSITPYAVLIHGHNEIGDVKCPICKETLYSSRFISLNPSFDPLLRSFGGFFPLLIGWYLTKININWAADVKIDQHEYGDIIFKNTGKYHLVECKIRSRDKNRRGIENGIEKAITQAINHIKYWEDHKVSIEKSAIFTNELDNEIFQEELQQAIKNKAEEIAGRKIRVYPIKAIPMIISELIA